MTRAAKASVDLTSTFLGALTIKLDQRVQVGATPAGFRTFAVIAGARSKAP
jgi:hypothetical protein